MNIFNAFDKVSNPFLVQSVDGTGILKLHQKGSFLDKGLELFQSGILTVEKEENGYNFVLNGVNYYVSDSLLVQGYLYQGIQEGKLQTQLFNAVLGFGSPAQARYKGEKVDVNLFEDYQELIDLIGGSIEKEPKSKNFNLLFTITEENHKLLINSSLILGDWITQGIKIAGIKIKLPKQTDNG